MARRDGPVRILVVYPGDLVAPTIGGVATFLRDFVRFAPTDLEIEIVGATSDSASRPVGRWHRWQVGGREARFLPLVHVGEINRRSRVPVSLRLLLASARHRRRLPIEDRNLQFHRPDMPLAFLGHRGPRVQIVHMDVREGPAQTGWRLLPGLYRRVEDLTIPRMDRVFVPNEAGVEFFRSRHPRIAEHVVFLPSWYDDTVFQLPLDGEREAARRDLLRLVGRGSDATDDRFVLFVGRLESVKDPRLLIDAFVALRATTAYRSHLVVAGEGRMRAAMEGWTRAAGVGGDVHVVGARSHDGVSRLMQACDALLLTSRVEGGGPRVVVEALASGLPVVTTAVGEVQRYVASGRNGWLAVDRRPALLAEGLRWVLEHRHEGVRKAAAASAAPYAAGRVLQVLYDTHRQLADARREEMPAPTGA